MSKNASSTSASATAQPLPFGLILMPVFFKHFYHEKNVQRKIKALLSEPCGCLCVRFSDGGFEEETQRGAGEGGGEGGEAERRGVGFAHPEGPAAVSGIKVMLRPGLKRDVAVHSHTKWNLTPISALTAGSFLLFFLQFHAH